MRKSSILIVLLLVFALSTTAFAATYDTIETTHGTHANPGITVYTYSADGKTITEKTAETINVCPMTKFSDLKTVDWSHKGIDFVLSHGYMNGTSDTKFEPNGSMTRAMIVTVLYRVADDMGLVTGKTGAVPFTDVKSGIWYADAIKWAYASNVAKGVDKKTFAPDASVTREQITLFICRFAKLIGDDVSAKGDISKFSDVAKLSSESKSAISWAVGKDIVKGIGNGKIGPKDTATRAQFATMLQRWLDGRCTGHDYVLSKSVKATCKADGGKYYVCSICGAEKYVRIPSDGHSYGKKTVINAPTCTENGTYERVCKDCGKKITGTLPASGHDYDKNTIIQKPTCTEEGISEQICLNCGHRIMESIPATGHSYGVKEVTKAPTCTENGIYEQTCADCGKKITGIVPANGHNYGEKKTGKAASCTEEGTYIKECSVCGNTVIVGTIPMTEHAYTEKVIKEPSCTATGEKQKICSVCGKTVTYTMPVTPHEYVDGICTGCGKHEQTAIKTSSLNNGDIIIIFNPFDNLALGDTEKGIALSSVPATINDDKISIEEGMAVLTVEKTSKGFYFTNDDGKYLSCNITADGCKLCFSEAKTDNALWAISSNCIMNVNAKLDGNAQYIGCRKNCFECIEFTDNGDIFLLEFYKVP